MSEARDLAVAPLGAGRPFWDTSPRIRPLMALSECARLRGQPATALRRSREAASLALGLADRYASAVLAPMVALELCWLGEPVIAEWVLQSIDSPVPSSEESDVMAGIARARLLALNGELRQADKVAEGVIGIAAGNSRWQVLSLCWAVRALAALRTGQAHTAERLVARYVGSEEVGFAILNAQPRWIALQAATERAGPARGIDLLLGPYEGLIATPVLFIEEPGAAPWMVRTALAAGAPQVAREAVVAVRRLADANPDFAPAVVSALHAEGLYRQDRELLTRAGREHRDPWAAAGAAEDLAVLLDRSDLTDRLTVALPLAMARNSYEKAGDLAGAARVSRWLSRLGPFLDAPSAGPRIAGDQQLLSGSERAVVELVVQGMTNRRAAERLDISPNTVNFHLRNVFRKFGIGSRVELARLYQSPHPMSLPAVRRRGRAAPDGGRAAPVPARAVVDPNACHPKVFLDQS